MCFLFILLVYAFSCSKERDCSLVKIPSQTKHSTRPHTPDTLHLSIPKPTPHSQSPGICLCRTHSTWWQEIGSRTQLSAPLELWVVQACLFGNKRLFNFFNSMSILPYISFLQETNIAVTSSSCKDLHFICSSPQTDLQKLK